MKLTDKEKDELASHYRNVDIYDPAKDPQQDPMSKPPHGYMHGGSCYDKGGMVPMNLAEGGDATPEIDISLPGSASMGLEEPELSGGTQTARGKITTPPLEAPIAPPRAITPQSAPAPISRAIPQAAPAIAPAVPQNIPSAAVPASEASKSALNPSEFDALVKALQPTGGQRVAEGLSSGLAGLADAIESGVARAPSPGFTRALDEQRQAQRQNLINALRAKYETGFKGAELEQGRQRLGEEVRQHNIEAGQRAATLEYEKGKEARETAQAEAKQKVDAAQKVVEAYQKGSLLNPSGVSSEEYRAAQKVLEGAGQAPQTVRIVDSTGKQHDLPLKSLGEARKRDPGLKVVQ